MTQQQLFALPKAASSQARNLFRPSIILLNRKAADSEMAKHVIQANPQAEVVEIAANTHSWNGKRHSLEATDFFKVKRSMVAVLHRGAQWRPDPNGRSTDFLPNVKLGTGCAFFCQYCYVERGKPNSYPKVYDDAFNIVPMIQYVADNEAFYLDHYQKCLRGKKFEKHRDPAHPPYITFDLGCDTDCVVDNQITQHADYPGHVVDIMNQVGEIPGVMTSFATKGNDFEAFIKYCKYKHKNRIRLSLMPEHHRQVLEINTSTIIQRLNSINQLVAAGFEVHINLSPIVVTEQYEEEYRALLQLIDDMLTPEAKKQMAYEIIYLTHSKTLYEPTQARKPEAHQMMAEGPYELAPKPHKKTVLTYGRKDKNQLKRILRELIEETTPYARIRYMF